MAAPKKEEAPVAEAPVQDVAPETPVVEEPGDLFEEAHKAAPNLTREFVEKYGLDEDWLKKIARGELSPPPTVGPEHTVDLHYVNGGWQITPVGVAPEDVGKGQMYR
jgi:hypothetical protein